MKIHKGDNIIIISGKDRGRRSKVLKVFPKRGKITVEGINIRKKHIRPRKSGEKGQIVEIASPISVSNAKLLCLKCGKTTKVGYKLREKDKYRICRKCGEKV